MNEVEFKNKWHKEKQFYDAWGQFVVAKISDELTAREKDLNIFLKIPAKSRLKSESSLIDKAFYRNKKYSEPYLQIEDKVGARFVVLLIEDIDVICSCIEKLKDWDIDPCKHFKEDKEKDPLLFTYQSVHYILRSKHAINFNEIEVPANTPCEVQIRTLLQHAHAELTHDAVYKTNRIVKPSVQRTVAKSMALIETTDEFFTRVTNDLNYGPLQEHGVIERLDGLYYSFTGLKSHSQKSALTIWDEFEAVIDMDLVDKIQNQLINDSTYSFLADQIRDNFSENMLYQQSTVLFVYWMLLFKRKRLFQDWPMPSNLLNSLASDLGISTWDG